MRPTNSFLGIFSFLSSIPFSSAECTRESLLTTANTYLSAQISGSLTSLPLSTTNFTYRENNKIIDLKKGILSTPLKVSFNRSTADTTSCASYTNLIVTTGSKPYVISTQIRHAMNSTDVVMIDSIVATSKDLFFNATLTQSYLLKENWGMVQGARSSREELKRIGDAYLDMWTDAKAADSIPWGTDCERVRNPNCYGGGCFEANQKTDLRTEKAC
jgi:hypothetical protein